jgi:hypothetical protein
VRPTASVARIVNELTLDDMPDLLFFFGNRAPLE